VIRRVLQQCIIPSSYELRIIIRRWSSRRFPYGYLVTT